MDWAVFFSVFGLVFVAELGDKTQLAVVTQTCKYRRPWAVFVGASVALGIVTALGVVAGQALGHLIPEGVLRTVAALAFIMMGVLVAREALEGEGNELDRLPGDRRCVDPGDDCSGRMPISLRDWRAFAATFGLLFVAELGDKTQLATMSLSSKHGDAWTVLGGAALALTLVTALGVVGGRMVCKLVPQRLILRLSAILFILMGILMGVGAL